MTEINEEIRLAVLRGRADEKQRIIKLLEEQRFICSDEQCCWLATEYSCHCKDAIALIKGEK